MEILRTISTLLPLAVTSGINLYATILVVGLSIRLQWVQNIPSGLDVLASWPIIIIAGVFFLLESLADKIQFIDNLWDLIHTVIRPLGAAFIGFAVLGKADPVIVVIAVLIAGGMALVSHGGKAGSRVALNVISPVENVKNIGLSLAEDVVAGSLTFVALKYPFLATGIALVILVMIIVIVPQLMRWVWFNIVAIFTWLKSLGHKLLKREIKSDSLPSEHLSLLRHKPPELASRCKAQGVQGASGRSGYIFVWGKYLGFTYNKWFMSQVWYIKLDQIITTYLHHRALMDVMEVHYRDNKKECIARFAFLKDRTPLAKRLTVRLKEKDIVFPPSMKEKEIV